MITKLLKFTLLFAALLFFTNCSKETKDHKSEEEILEEFTEQFYEFYDTYGDGDISFVDYYSDDVISMDNTGEVTIGNENYREIWTENFKRVRIDKLDYTDPEIIFSREMIFTYNKYDERFIYTESGDTTEVRGTWLAVWKPINDEWKVVMNTFHSNSD